MTKHVHVIDALDADGVPTTADNFGMLDTMIAKAKMLNPPETAKYRFRITMGGKIKQLALEWND